MCFLSKDVWYCNAQNGGVPANLPNGNDQDCVSPPNSEALLTWYDRHAREMPWRVGPAQRRDGQQPDPYKIWLSEVMLQQTTVAAVKAYFLRFTSRWPTVTALAAAEDGDVDGCMGRTGLLCPRPQPVEMRPHSGHGSRRGLSHQPRSAAVAARYRALYRISNCLDCL